MKCAFGVILSACIALFCSGVPGWNAAAADDSLQVLKTCADDMTGNRSAKLVLYDNGPLVTTPGGGYSGADISELQMSLGMNTLGAGCQLFYENHVADDFEVTETWNVESVTFFCYQTGTYGYPPDSTITDLFFQIWDGPPDDPGSSVIWGNLTTDRLTATEWSGIYRVSETNQTDTMRPIMTATCDVTINLSPGVYWIDWMINGTLSSGPWQPPITILGETTTGNGKQYTDDWADFVDSGTLTPQGFPFLIEGTFDTAVEGMLFSIRDDDNYLVRINPDTLGYTVIGETGVASGNFGGMAYDPIHEIMYWIPGRYNNNLYTLDLTTGHATLIGPLNVTDLFGLAYDSLNGVLYATQFGTGSGLYSLNVSTGASTLIGTMSRKIGGLAYNSETDALIGIEDGLGDLYLINRSTGMLTLIYDGSSTNNSGLEYDPVRNYYWDIDWSGNLFFYDIDNAYARTTALSGLDSHDGLAMVTAPECINHGDTNLDGLITAADAQLAFYIVLGLYSPAYQEECAADCNGDDTVTAADAQAIFLTVLGLGACADPL
jgi:hypothetical protein